MKCTTISKSLMLKSMVLGAALILAGSAFAASKGSLELNNPVMVNGTKVKPGDYKVEWDGSGPDVEVSILQGKNVIAKAPAHVVTLDTVAQNNAAVTHKTDDGTSALAGIRFAGKKFALEIPDAGGSMQAGSAK